MKKTTVGILAALAAVSMTGAANAQMGPTTPFSVELRAGAALPTGDFGEGLNTGWTAGLTAQYNFTPMIGVYGGYSFTSFGADEEEVGEDEDVNINDRGFNAGLRASFAPMAAGLSPWIKGGLVYNELEFEVDGESLTSDSKLGFEVGGGLAFPLGPRISITPGVTYTAYSFDDEDLDLDLDVSHVKIDIGLNFRI
jgi:opacity protein-like surface antigen